MPWCRPLVITLTFYILRFIEATRTPHDNNHQNVGWACHYTLHVRVSLGVRSYLARKWQFWTVCRLHICLNGGSAKIVCGLVHMLARTVVSIIHFIQRFYRDRKWISNIIVRIEPIRRVDVSVVHWLAPTSDPRTMCIAAQHLHVRIWSESTTIIVQCYIAIDCKTYLRSIASFTRTTPELYAITPAAHINEREIMRCSQRLSRWWNFYCTHFTDFVHIVVHVHIVCTHSDDGIVEKGVNADLEQCRNAKRRHSIIHSDSLRTTHTYIFIGVQRPIERKSFPKLHGSRVHTLTLDWSFRTGRPDVDEEKCDKIIDSADNKNNNHRLQLRTYLA